MLGHRDSYALAPKPLDCGGQAEVRLARHKPSGNEVAFKRVLAHDEESLARMKREVEVQTKLL